MANNFKPGFSQLSERKIELATGHTSLCLILVALNIWWRQSVGSEMLADLERECGIMVAAAVHCNVS